MKLCSHQGQGANILAFLLLAWVAPIPGASRAAERALPPKLLADPPSARAGKNLSKVFGAAEDTSPERVFLTLTTQPATSQAVSWRTRPTSNQLCGAVIRASGGPIKEKGARIVPATVERVLYGGGQALFQASVAFTNLQPATLYAYRVGDGQTWSEWNQFRTAEDGPAPFRFLYIGDLQNGIRSQGSRVLRQAVLKAPDARFLIHAGDLVTDPFNDRLWHEWYAAAGWIYATFPSLLTPGNHDMAGGAADKVWRPQFDLPHNGPRGQEDLSYYVDYQGVRLVSFNGNAYQDREHLNWLETALAKKTSSWTIVVSHQPLYATGGRRDASKRRDRLMPLYDRYGVDLVLQGHDHTYGRTPKIHAGRVVAAGEPGVVYATSVGGSKMYKLNPTSRPFMARLAADLQLFQVVSVAPDHLAYEAYTADGTLFDSFELHKHGPDRTELIDRAPKD